MSERAKQLADELQQVTDEVAAFIAGIPDAAWQRTCAAEQCTVAALACHIADGYGPILESLVKPIAEGTEGPRYSMEQLAQWNTAAARRTRRNRKRSSWSGCAPTRRRPSPTCGSCATSSYSAPGRCPSVGTP